MRRGGRHGIAPSRRTRTGTGGGGRRILGPVSLLAGLLVTPASPARAAIDGPPATLEFGLITGEWGIFADGDGFPGVPMQGMVGAFVPGTIALDEMVAEPGAAAAVWMNAAATLETDSDALRLEFSLSLAAEAAVDAGAPPAATAIATASFQRIDLGFLVLEPAWLTIESLEEDGRWRVLELRRVAAGSEDVFLTALPALTLEAAPGDQMLGAVDAGIRVTLVRVPAPPVAAVLLAPLLRASRRRRDCRPSALRPSPPR